MVTIEKQLPSSQRDHSRDVFGTIMQLIACNITTVQLEVYKETNHGTFCDDDQEYLACRGGCTLGQEGSDDPLECLKFCCGLCEPWTAAERLLVCTLGARRKS